MPEPKIDALLALKSDGRLLVGRERIRLLEAVAAHGNISQAAKVLGFSYKTAWDAVTAINNLLPRPAFVTRAGGRSGGGAEVTQEGLRLIAAFHTLEGRLARISAAIAEDGLDGQEDFLLWSLGLRISARNVFRADVEAITRDPVDVRVDLRLSDAARLTALVTNEAADELALAPGRGVLALVKAPAVQLARADAPAQAAPVENRFAGRVIRRIDARAAAGSASDKSEIVLDIGDGKTMTAVLPWSVAEREGLREGMEVHAGFSASHVVLIAG